MNLRLYKPNWAKRSQRARFPKIWCISSTLSVVDLAPRNFPGPLALRIWNYMHLSWFWKLLTEIDRESSEISSFFLWNKFRIIRQALSARFARRCTIKSCCTTALRCSPSLQAMWNTLVGATRLSRRGSPRQGRQNWGKCQFTVDEYKNLLNFAICKNEGKRRESEQNSRMELISKTLTLFNISEINFLEPLAFRIWNYMP